MHAWNQPLDNYMYIIRRNIIVKFKNRHVMPIEFKIHRSHHIPLHPAKEDFKGKFCFLEYILQTTKHFNSSTY